MVLPLYQKILYLKNKQRKEDFFFAKQIIRTTELNEKEEKRRDLLKILVLIECNESGVETKYRLLVCLCAYHLLSLLYITSLYHFRFSSIWMFFYYFSIYSHGFAHHWMLCVRSFNTFYSLICSSKSSSSI